MECCCEGVPAAPALLPAEGLTANELPVCSCDQCYRAKRRCRQQILACPFREPPQATGLLLQPRRDSRISANTYCFFKYTSPKKVISLAVMMMMTLWLPLTILQLMILLPFTLWPTFNRTCLEPCSALTCLAKHAWPIFVDLPRCLLLLAA